MNTSIKLIFIVFLSFTAFSQSLDDFKIIYKHDSVSTYLFAHNKTPASVTLKISNKKTDKVITKYIVSSSDSIVFLKKSGGDKKVYLQEIKSKYKFSYHFGDSLSSKHNDDYLYDFPFKRRHRYKLIQGWGGSFSHNNPKSYHAFDFKMKTGEPVHAARSGIVARIVDTFTENGGPELRNYANTIIIRHEDNTFAHYVHLRPNGSTVEVGQKVEKGELIGFSGNTGFSTQPHLHFVVRDGSGNSIPIYFKGRRNKKLKTNKSYRR
jgi:murein DD-endopeptidase MepM/ murein hydrolase activator NlpD